MSACSQNAEFKVYPNGLIYSERTMAKLSRIVDSLNLKYKTCNYNTVFNSKSQTIGHVVKMEKGNILAAKNDLQNAISLDEFLKKYPEAKIERDVLILRSKYKNYQNQEIVDIQHFDLNSDYGFSIESEDLSLYQKDFTNKWLFDY